MAGVVSAVVDYRRLAAVGAVASLGTVLSLHAAALAGVDRAVQAVFATRAVVPLLLIVFAACQVVRTVDATRVRRIAAGSTIVGAFVAVTVLASGGFCAEAFCAQESFRASVDLAEGIVRYGACLQCQTELRPHGALAGVAVFGAGLLFDAWFVIGGGRASAGRGVE